MPADRSFADWAYNVSENIGSAALGGFLLALVGKALGWDFFSRIRWAELAEIAAPMVLFAGVVVVAVHEGHRVPVYGIAVLAALALILIMDFAIKKRRPPVPDPPDRPLFTVSDESKLPK
jgi:hypothetical protein